MQAVPDASASMSEDRLHMLYGTLYEYLQLEDKFQPNLCLPDTTENLDDVTRHDRDEAAQVLRSLKIWYDLPSEVLIDAVHLFDRFLTKMKVRRSHIPCITMACMNLVIEEYSSFNPEVRKIPIEELVAVTQPGCTVRDIGRMSHMIRDKLALAGAACDVTPSRWLRLMCALTGVVSAPLAAHLELLVVGACGGGVVRTVAVVLALVVRVCREEDVDAVRTLAHHCRVEPRVLHQVQQMVSRELSRYETPTPHTSSWARRRRRPRPWRLSERTLKVLRPTDRLGELLPTIEERHHV